MKVIVVTKRSTWEQYHQNPGAFGKLGRESMDRAKASHARHLWAVSRVLESLPVGVKPWVIVGAETSFNPSGANLVITVGGDGTLLSASHHVGPDTPLLGVNSDPVFSRGHFCSLTAQSPLVAAFQKALTAPRIQKVTRMAVRLQGKFVAKRVLNEALFSHTCPAAMTRLVLGTKRYDCSGVWIGTGAGSTGAIVSAGGLVQPPTSKRLQAVIREPCGANPGASSLARTFRLVSKTPDATLYLDGPFLRVPVGVDQRVEFAVSPEYLSLVATST